MQKTRLPPATVQATGSAFLTRSVSREIASVDSLPHAYGTVSGTYTSALIAVVTSQCFTLCAMESTLSRCIGLAPWQDDIGPIPVRLLGVSDAMDVIMVWRTARVPENT